MKVKVFPIDVRSGEHFSDDLLSRPVLLRRLSRFVSLVPSPFALAIDSPWGTGKSVLLKMWAAELESLGLPVVAFNAWQADHAEEPLAPILAAFRDRFPKEGKELLKKSARLVSAIAKSSVPLLAKAATMGVLDVKSADIEGALAEAVEKAAADQIESFSRKRDQVLELRKLLGATAKSEKSGRIVVMVDELDRCRPPFALALLERVKNVLDVEGLVFVFALDRSQLAHSVCGVYGSDFDGSGYLDRFFDQVYRLPPPPISDFARAVLEKRLGISDVLGTKGTPAERRFLIHFFCECCTALGLSLREVEQCAGRLATLIFTVPQKNYIQPVAKVVLSIISQARPAWYASLLREPAAADRVASEIEALSLHKSREEISAVASVVACVLAVPKELFSSESQKRIQLENELRKLNERSDQGRLNKNEQDRLLFLESAVNWNPGERHLGFGVKAAVEAIAFALDFIQDEATAPQRS